MAQKHADAILQKVKDAKVWFKHTVHEPVITSADAARVRNTTLESGAKALVVKTKKSQQVILCVIPAHKKLDTKKLKNVIGEKVGFVSDPEEAVGCKRGSVPPFGSVLGVQTYADNTLEDELTFNIGLLTESLNLKKEDYITIEKPIMCDIAQNTVE